jgi:hypothetical protein
MHGLKIVAVAHAPTHPACPDPLLTSGPRPHRIEGDIAQRRRQMRFVHRHCQLNVFNEPADLEFSMGSEIRIS